MKSKIPTFLLSKQDDKTFITHTKKPPFVAEYIRFKSISEKETFLESVPDEYIEPDSFSVIVIRKYLSDADWKRKEYILKQLIYWIRKLSK